MQLPRIWAAFLPPPKSLRLSEAAAFSFERHCWQSPPDPFDPKGGKRCRCTRGEGPFRRGGSPNQAAPRTTHTQSREGPDASRVMERMSSTEATAEEQRRWSTELQQRQWAARAAVFEGGDMQHRSSGCSPEPELEAPDSPERQEVALTIGNADLEGLQVIEDIPPHRRITISAHVPALLAPPHLLSRLNPAKLFRRRAAVSAEPSAKGPSHRQVRRGSMLGRGRHRAPVLKRDSP